MQTRSGEQVCNPASTHGGQGGGELLDDGGDAVREAIDGFWGAKEGFRAILVATAGPDADCGVGNEETASGSGQAPTIGGAKAEDGETVWGWVVRSTLSGQARQAAILDFQLTAERTDLGPQTVDLDPEPGSLEGTVGSPTSDV